MLSCKYWFLVVLNLIILLSFTACTEDVSTIGKENVSVSSNNNNENALFELLDESTLDFANELTDLPEQNIFLDDYFYTGSGVAIGDVNNDDLLDVYITGNQVENKLFINKGNFEFEDITVKSGTSDKGFWSTGANIFDINNDGWNDIYVCHAGSRKFYNNHQNHLYINNQDGTFTESAIAYGLKDNSQTSQVAQIDYDLDGDLDLFVSNHVDFVRRFKSIKSQKEKFEAYETYLNEKDNRKECSNILFENKGNNKFEDVTEKANLYDWGYGLSVVISDLNKDNLPDIYIANDYVIPDFMYYNNGDGTFSEVLEDKVGHTSFYSMGCDIADFNNDTWPDIAVVDMTSPDRVRNKTLMPAMNEMNFRYAVDELGFQEQYMFNVMQKNNGNGTFSNIGHLTGIASTDWSWSSLLADFDLDGDKDYLVTNGVKRDARNRDIENQINDEIRANKRVNKITNEERLALVNRFPSVPQLNYLYENKGDYNFKNVSSEWGFSKKGFTNGAAYADLDNDGDLDLVLNNINDKAHIYRNKSADNKLGNFLSVRFDNEPKNLNATVLVYTNNVVQHREFNQTRGYFSVMQPALHFGVGNVTVIDSIVINWLYGKKAVYKKVKANEVLNVSINDKNVKPVTPKKTTNTFFTTLDNNTLNIDYKHEENKFSDFKREVLLPHMQSRNGPHISVADINADGLDDFFIGGAHNKLAAIYTQTKAGKFTKTNQPALTADIKQEDIGSAFFDYDNDGDLDLYVVSGGNEAKPFGPLLIDRLYKNNGKGMFIKTENTIPYVNTSGGKVLPNDYDNDGDIDLLITGRIIPGNYPVPTKTTLLQNDNGKFTDITEIACNSLKNVGIITDAKWVDINADNLMDILLVGEWSGIEVLIQESESFIKKTSDYFEDETRGWWFSLVAEDFDKDGDIDIVAGNLGLNNKFHASKKKPFDIYFSDFDSNGINDIVLAKTEDGNQYLMRGKDCSSEQMPFINDKFKTYEGFANATITEVLTPEKLDKSIHYSVKDFSSAYFEQKNGKFIRTQLPIESQFSPIQDILCKDFNGDGYLDLLTAGNLFDTEVETAAYDAGTGNLLINNKNGGFNNMTYKESGLYLAKNTKDLNFINIKGELHFIVANNNDIPQVVKINKQE